MIPGFFRSLWTHLFNEDLSITAAALAFSTALSVVPFLAVTLSALNTFEALGTITPKVEAALLDNLKGPAGVEGVQLIRKGIGRIHRGRLGSLGAVILILIATRVMFGLERAYHRIWQIRNKRPLLRRILFYWIFLAVFPFVLALWIGMVGWIGKPALQGLLLRPGYVLTFLCLFVLQKWLPSRPVGWFPAAVGTTFSVCSLWALEKFYKWVTVQVFSYSKVYGSLAAIPASLLWMFMVWLVILWGVALTAVIQKETVPALRIPN